MYTLHHSETKKNTESVRFIKKYYYYKWFQVFNQINGNNTHSLRLLLSSNVPGRESFKSEPSASLCRGFNFHPTMPLDQRRGQGSKKSHQLPNFMQLHDFRPKKSLQNYLPEDSVNFWKNDSFAKWGPWIPMMTSWGDRIGKNLAPFGVRAFEEPPPLW